jgi:hypothetical protein
VVSITPRPRFTPGERTPGTHCTGGWVGPRAGLDTEDRGKSLCPRRGSNPDRPVVQPVVRHYTAWANPAPLKKSKHDIIIISTVKRTGARNGNLEVPVDFLERNKDMTSDKREKINGYSVYWLTSVGMKLRNKKKFRYGIPAYAGPVEHRK